MAVFVRPYPILPSFSMAPYRVFAILCRSDHGFRCFSMRTLDLSLGERILLTRVRAGQNQSEFGRRFQVKALTIRGWETGSAEPRPKNMQILSQLYAEYL